jgi:hypothetical protein
VLCGTHLARSDAGLLGEHRGRVLGGSGWSGAHGVPDRAGWPVQQESTATGADLTGRARTSWDGDLHRRTAVDALPADGMQEVRGSNPRSSTGKKRNSNSSYGEYSSKVQQRGRRDLLSGQPGSGSASPPGLLAWPAEAGTCDGSSGAVTRKNALFVRPLTAAPPLAHGARFRVTFAAWATRQASHARPGCCCVSSHACGQTAPWRSMVRRLAPGAASSVSRRGRGAPRRNLAHPGARHRAARRGPSA